MIKLCEHCGNKFQAYHLNKQRFCSKVCQRKAWRGPRRKWEYAPKQTTCETCKNIFKPRNSKARFCSRNCLYISLGGSTSPSWKGGRIKAVGGYVAVLAPLGHPKVRNKNGHGIGYVLEHRLTMEKKLGRYLEDHETIHHINGNRTDNRIENLQLRSGRHGKGVIHKCADCGSTNIISKHLV